jgi:hypothetical protein
VSDLGCQRIGIRGSIGVTDHPVKKWVAQISRGEVVEPVTVYGWVE